MSETEAPSLTGARLLTGAGRGAISVVSVAGPNAVTIVDGLFHSDRGRPLSQTPVGRPRFGRFGLDRCDEVVVVILAKNPPHVEIQGHGGSAATRLLLDSLASRGVKIQTDLPNPCLGQVENWAAEARLALTFAPTLRTAQILLDQVEGALDRDLERLRHEMQVDQEAARRRLDTLLSRSDVGLRLVKGFRIAITGRPNVGKSLLLNALAGFDRAVVSAVAGTTRDIVTVTTAIEGWPVEIADTAGLHETEQPLEVAGIALARLRLKAADLVLIVLDRSCELLDEDRAVIAAYPQGLLVANKSDLEPSWDAAGPGAIPVSAATGEGLQGLLREIARRLVPEPPESGAAVPFREDLTATLRRMRDAIPG